MQIRRCIACAKSGAWHGELCPHCCQDIGFDQRARCFVCTRPLRGVGTEALAFCRDCREGTPLGRVMGLGLHRPPLSTLIHRFKFMGEYRLAEVLGQLLKEAATRALAADGETRPPWGAVIPVPMHKTRERARGYNQAQLLAKVLAALWQLPVDDRWLIRVREAGSQVHRTGMLRRREMAEAFALAQRHGWWWWRRAEPPWRGQAVLLVDDVFTTGSTARSCAQVLLDAGATRVDLAVLAVSGRSTP